MWVIIRITTKSSLRSQQKSWNQFTWTKHALSVAWLWSKDFITMLCFPVTICSGTQCYVNTGAQGETFSCQRLTSCGLEGRHPNMNTLLTTLNSRPKHRLLPSCPPTQSFPNTPSMSQQGTLSQLHPDTWQGLGLPPDGTHVWCNWNQWFRHPKLWWRGS